MFSKRINRIEESGIRKVFNLAAEAGEDLINLSIGQPHFPAPQKLKNSLIKATQENFNSYTPTLGVTKLRERIAQKLTDKNGISAKAEEVMITNGVSGAIFLLLSAIIDEGDEVILADPYFVLYREVLNFLGAKIIYHNTYPDFHLKMNKLNNEITEKTKLVIINSPNNPTGAVYSKEELEELSHILEKHQTMVLSDEIYEAFDYDQKFTSLASVYPNTITLNGFSKSLSITGWRVGYLHTANLELIDKMNQLQQYTFVCAPSIAQHAILESFELSIEEEVKDYLNKRDFVYKNLNQKYNLNKTEGAFYAFIKKPKIEKFVEKLAKNKVLAVPGEVFSTKDSHFRISFAVSDEVLEKGVGILNAIV